MSKVIEGQTSLDLFDAAKNVPGNCPHEARTVDIGGGKSYCDLMRLWTNCRCVGHCVYEKRNR